jgi:hypothetical protein
MPRTKFSTTDLNQLCHQLDTWRQSQSRARRLPEALWRSAAIVATTQGVGYVARALRLDYNKLKRQVPQAPADSVPLGPPSFVELRPRELLAQASAVCRIELSDPAGAKMTVVDLPCDPATVVGLAQAFWRRG